MITIYHVETSRSARIVRLMEELGLDYALENFPREPNAGAPSPLKAVHERGSGPWFAGAEFTADVMMAFPFTTMRHFCR